VFKQTQPILGTRDMRRAITFYTQKLGFKLAFGAVAGEEVDAEHPNYVGYRRDGAELHMQFQYEHEMGTMRLRFLVDDPDTLYAEYREQGVDCSPSGVLDRAWGTREFGLYDPDGNSLTFYRDLTAGENP
jgi:catechol 2,3-dioxygenase-like lactoylglutathione lyase family enzyme